MPIPLLLPVGTAGVSLYQRLFQIWDALWERKIATGADHWPPTHLAWASGTVVGVTINEDGGYVVDCGTVAARWIVPAGQYSPQNSWVGYRPPDTVPGTPTAYDIVIEGDPRKPWETVRGPINAQFPQHGDTYDSSTHATVTITGTSTGAGWGIAIQPAIVGKFIPDLSSLADRTWHIIKRGGLWSNERMPELPNDHEAWKGVSNAGGTVHVPPAPADSDHDGTPDDPDAPAEGPLYSYAEDSDTKVNWTADRWTGYELLIRDLSNALHRVTIEHNDARRLYWTDDGSWTATGLYTVVVAGSRGIPGRIKWRPALHYAGAGEAFYTRVPESEGDPLTTRAILAADKVHWQELAPDGESCEDVAHPEGTEPGSPTSALDQDLQIHGHDYHAICDSGKTDDFPAPGIYKTIRHVQWTILDEGQNWVKTVPTGDQAVKKYYAAELLASVGTENGSTTIYREGPHSDSPTFDVSDEAAYAGKVYYVVYQSTGVVRAAGVADVDFASATVTLDNLITPVDMDDGGDNVTDFGKQVVWGVGFRRYFPRRVRYLEPRTCFQPDVLSDDIGFNTVADPPHVTAVIDHGTGEPTGDYSGEGTGKWIRRGKSTNYAEMDDYGSISDSGPVFQAGDLVRVVGDNFGDPTILERVPASATSNSTGKLMLPYYDLFYRGTYPRAVETRYRGGRSGVSTRGGKNYLTDVSQDWWSDGVNNGTLVTHSYEAADGTTTSVTLNIDMTDHTSQQSPWFGGDRFAGMPGGPFVDFVVEITQTQSVHDPVAGGSATRNVDFLYKMPITGFTDLGTTIKLVFDTVAQSSGIAYEDDDVTPIAPKTTGDDTFTAKEHDTVVIKEPKYTLNKFEERLVTLTSPAGTSYTASVFWNDADTLWIGDAFDDDFSPVDEPLDMTAPGWTYQIDYVPPGTVLRWNGGGWEIPTGADTPRLGTGGHARNFLPALANNLPTYVKHYGLHRRGDRILDVVQLDEIRKSINLMKRNVKDYTWTNTLLDGSLGPDNRRFADCFGPGKYESVTSDPNPYGASPSQFHTFLITGTDDSVPRPDFFSVNPPGGYSDDAASSKTGDGTPFYSYSGEWSGTYSRIDSYIYLSRQAAYGRLNKSPVISAATDWYVWGAISSTDPDEAAIPDDGPNDRIWDTTVFDSGSDPIAYRSWTKWGTTASNNDPIIYSDTRLGETGLSGPPPTGGKIPDRDISTFVNNGWYPKATVAILTWDFVYQDGTW